MKKLPIGIQTFSKIIEENCYYVDKTKILWELTESGKYYFLSRPRRFGKSLFLDTIQNAFEGNRTLFKGLFLEKNWDWDKKYPVIKIDFAGGVLQNPEILNQKILEIIEYYRRTHSLSVSPNQTLSGKFEDLIRNLHSKYGNKAVILVDEYDKPILDNITDNETAVGMRDGLRNLYSVIKGMDAYIHFVFITGVSKFSRINLFSGLNNLNDISLDERYSAVCGYTEEELSVFEERLIDVDRDKLKLWYNGYNFMGIPVYNPFDILLYLDSKTYRNYWFETGTPTFLIQLIEKYQYNIPKLENIKLTDSHLSSFDVDSITLENLLFQTGYLTIKERKQMGGMTVYILKYPNLEVKHSLTDAILNYLSNLVTQKEENKMAVYSALEEGRLQDFRQIFHSFFASIPHNWYRKNTMANYEGYYASVFYCYLTAIGLDVRAEEVTNQGQVDMTAFLDNLVYVFEFKVIEMTESGSALGQIKKKKYYEKYISAENREIYLVGVEFSSREKNITVCEWEKV